MDKPQSFEEVFKDAYNYWIDDANIHRYEGAKGLADQVWQHQQAKVEELQKRVDLVKRELKAAKEGHYGFNDEGADIDSFIFDLEQALKGEG